MVSRNAAHTANIVSPMPKYRFPIKLADLLLEPRSDPARRGCLQIVNQDRDVQGRVDLHQEVDVILFAAEFDKPAAPSVRVFRKKRFLGKPSSPV